VGGISNPQNIRGEQRRKLTGKSNWFKDKKKKQEQEDDYNNSETEGHVGAGSGGRDMSEDIGATKEKPGDTREGMRTKTVLFVEQTPKGELARRMREVERRLPNMPGFKSKVSDIPKESKHYLVSPKTNNYKDKPLLSFIFGYDPAIDC
jgi:hypothetical protein